MIIFHQGRIFWQIFDIIVTTYFCIDMYMQLFLPRQILNIWISEITASNDTIRVNKYIFSTLYIFLQLDN